MPKFIRYFLLISLLLVALILVFQEFYDTSLKDAPKTYFSGVLMVEPEDKQKAIRIVKNTVTSLRETTERFISKNSKELVQKEASVKTSTSDIVRIENSTDFTEIINYNTSADVPINDPYSYVLLASPNKQVIDSSIEINNSDGVPFIISSRNDKLLELKSSGDRVLYVTNKGDIKLDSSADLYMGDVGLVDKDSVYSGASLIGLYDNNLFNITANTNLQSGFEFFDMAIGSRIYTEQNYTVNGESLATSLDTLDRTVYDLASGSIGLWQDAGTYIYPANFSNLSITDIGYLGVGTTTPQYNLDIVGSLRTSQLITPYAHTLTVAKSGGDYTTIADAVDAINTFGDASDGNRYLINLMPGTYTEDIVMPDFVAIMGAGFNVTTIAGTVEIGSGDMLTNVLVYPQGTQLVAIDAHPDISTSYINSCYILQNKNVNDSVYLINFRGTTDFRVYNSFLYSKNANSGVSARTYIVQNTATTTADVEIQTSHLKNSCPASQTCILAENNATGVNADIIVTGSSWSAFNNLNPIGASNNNPNGQIKLDISFENDRDDYKHYVTQGNNIIIAPTKTGNLAIDLGTSFTSGTALELGFPTNTVLSGTLLGGAIDLVTHVTDGNNAVTGLTLTLPDSGTATATGINITGSPDYGFYISGEIANYISGNMGIGEVNPSSKLEVAGNLELDDYLYFNNAQTQYLGFDGTNFNLTSHVLPTQDDQYDLGSGTTRWRDIYLGPTSLHFISTIAETGTARDWKFGIQETAGVSRGNLRLVEGSTEILNVTPAGNVGIGTTNPLQQLDLTKSIGLTSMTNANQYGAVYKGSNRFMHDFNYGNNGTIVTNGHNTFLGINSGNFTMGSNATLVTEASDNSAFGFHTLTALTTGNRNTALGSYALEDATSGYSNTAVGMEALSANTTGYNNIALGDSALKLNVSGYSNIAIGDRVLYANGPSHNNIGIGIQALYMNDVGGENVAFGTKALFTNDAGAYNIAIGTESLYSNIDGHYNIALGYKSLTLNDGGYNNIAVGSQALEFNTSGAANTAIGNQSLNANFDGDYNVALGDQALFSNTDGYSNVALGYMAGMYAGVGSADNQLSNTSIYIGYDSRAGASGNTNEIVIGSNTVGNGSDTITLGNDSISRTLLQGRVGIDTVDPGTALSVAGLSGTSSYNLLRYDPATGDFYYDSSSARYKDNIEPFMEDFSKILSADIKLYTDKASGLSEIGLIAEELNGLGLTHLVGYKDGVPDSVRYERMPLYLLGITKEQEVELESLHEEATTLAEGLETVRGDFMDPISVLANNIDTLTQDLNTTREDLRVLNEKLEKVQMVIDESSSLSATIDTNITLALSEPVESSESSDSIPATLGVSTDLADDMRQMFDEFKTFAASLGLSDNNGDLTIATDFTVLGDTLLHNVTITGDLSFGQFTLNSLENSINIMGDTCYNIDTKALNIDLCALQTLYLQKNLAGNVDLFNGAVVFQPNGEIRAKLLEVDRLSLTPGVSIGRTTIKAGETDVAVTVPTATVNSYIFVSATYPVAIGGDIKEDGEIEIYLASPQIEDLEVTWWVLN